MSEISLLWIYLVIVLAFVGGFGTCAILCFGRERMDEPDVVPDKPEIDTHA